MLQTNNYFEVRAEVGIMVVKILTQKIIQDGDIQAMGEQLHAFADSGRDARVLVDWSQVDFVSAAFLGKLITFLRKLQERGGRMVFCGVHPEIYEVFAITKLNRLFDIRDTETEALSALAP
jgi:anti-sigma B factor antagonist